MAALIGLNVGSGLTWTGSLANLLWRRTAWTGTSCRRRRAQFHRVSLADHRRSRSSSSAWAGHARLRRLTLIRICGACSDRHPQMRHCCAVTHLPNCRGSRAVLGVSDDTVRRWIDAGRLPAVTEDGRSHVVGTDLAALAESLAEHPDRDATSGGGGERPQPAAGIVTRVKKDTVMAQVELICGPYRLVSLMSAEAADELGLEPGVRAIASVKSTNVVVERP